MSDRLTDAEAFMWRLENDPWLQSTFGALCVLDGPVDMARLEGRLRGAVLRMPRLRQRVVESPGHNPAWATDSEFDLAYHLRHTALPAESTETDLLDHAARIVADPLDRTRPLWQFHVIDHPGGSAVVTKLHHSVADGEASVQLSLEYMEFAPEPGDDPCTSADQVAELIAAETKSQDPLATWGAALRSGAESGIGRLRHVLGEAAMYMADPPRVGEDVNALFSAVRAGADQLVAGVAPSPLWAQRSRHRQLRRVTSSLPAAVSAAQALGGTLNDLLLTTAAEAAHRQHAAHGLDIDQLPGSFIVSTRAEGELGGNAFTPASIALPTRPLDLRQRFATVAGLTSAAKDSQQHQPNLFEALATPARLLPNAGLSALGRQQASKLDLATSNVRSSPLPVWVGGARIIGNCPIGPVAGTAANITLMSYCDQIDIGIHVDPTAIGNVDSFVADFEDAWTALTRSSA
ncbi:MAG: diacylglycerol O-acyltransferase [Candidatus Poriferisodalaceae bacterium]|jgi:diacylglycerol O-acyltransferase